MKPILTAEQSAHLIELGVDKSKASDFEEIYVTNRNDPNQFLETEYYRVFTLSDLLSLLPRDIIIDGYPYHLNIDYPYLLPDSIAVRYLDEEGDSLIGSICPDLIDCLYELLIWCIKEKFVKL